MELNLLVVLKEYFLNILARKKIKNINNSGFLKENGFEISHNEKVILSFSFKGDFIPPGEHNLVSINLTYPNGKNNVDIKNLVIAGEKGKSLDFSYFDTQKKISTFRTNQ